MTFILNFLKKNNKIVYIILAIFCLTPFITASLALSLGLVFALTLGTPFSTFTKKMSHYLLQASVVGLGFGMNLLDSVKAGSDGMLFTLFSVVSVMFMGIMVGKWLHISNVSSYLIASGTAICGGSAIAAVAPIAKANESEISISLVTIFLLNALGLFLFPVFGHWLQLTQHQFGMWAAIAIHDTSSVVGAAAIYGEEALKVATTVKLTRALWIIPLSVFTSFYFKSKRDKVFIPWFILFFVLAMVLNTYFHIPTVLTHGIVTVARQCLTLTLFFIGAGLSRSALKMVGVKPLLLGVILWIFIAIFSFTFIYFWY